MSRLRRGRSRGSVAMVGSVGILGAGPVAQAVAARCAAVGFPCNSATVVVGTASASVRPRAGDGVTACTVREAADADLVVLAVPFVKVPDIVKRVGDVERPHRGGRHQPVRSDSSRRTPEEPTSATRPAAIAIFSRDVCQIHRTGSATPRRQAGSLLRRRRPSRELGLRRSVTRSASRRSCWRPPRRRSADELTGRSAPSTSSNRIDRSSVRNHRELRHAQTPDRRHRGAR